MAKLILASVLCIFLLVKGTKAAVAATGASCDGTATTCAASEYCEAELCKIKEAETCNSTFNTPNCIAHASCPTSGGNQDKCTCASGYTANSGKTVCEANVGSSCDTDTPCVTGATCEGGTCKIQAEQNCATATTQCTAHAECDTTCKCSTDYEASGGVCVGTKELEAACSDDNCIPTAVCDGGTCKTKESQVNGSCTVASKAACDPNTLACQSEKCKSKIGVDCVGAGDCVSGATCEGSASKQCSCPTGVLPSSDKTKCGGAMGIAASMLLVVATFVTSRFL